MKSHDAGGGQESRSEGRAAQVDAVSRAFLAALSGVSASTARRVAYREWLRASNMRSPLLELQDSLLLDGVEMGVFGARDAALYRFVRIAVQCRAEELLPRKLQPLFLHAAICGFIAACWGHLPEEAFPDEIRRSMQAAWPLPIRPAGA